MPTDHKELKDMLGILTVIHTILQGARALK
jgi:hypothetical protein